MVKKFMEKNKKRKKIFDIVENEYKKYKRVVFWPNDFPSVLDEVQKLVQENYFESRTSVYSEISDHLCWDGETSKYSSIREWDSCPECEQILLQSDSVEQRYILSKKIQGNLLVQFQNRG